MVNHIKGFLLQLEYVSLIGSMNINATTIEDELNKRFDGVNILAVLACASQL